MSRIKITQISLIAAAVAWNGWMLGWLNHGRAGYLNMSISELEVRGQPLYHLFRGLDNLSAIFMILSVLGILSIYKFGKKLWLPVIGCLLLTLSGLTFFDTTHPLDCNRYLNPICTQAVATNNVSNTNNLHNDESRITAYLTVVLALLIVVWLTVNRSSLSLSLIGLGILAVAVVSLEILDNTDHIFANSVSERIWNLSVSGDFILIAYSLKSLTKKREGRKVSA